jgi:hypothetical protein
MKAAWLTVVLTLSSMVSGSQSSRPDPAAPPDEYRQKVAASVQDIASGRLSRAPQMSGVSTGRLILEGVVENVRIYRLHKEEKVREAKEMEEEERRRREGRSRRHGRDCFNEGRHGHRSSRPDGDGETHRKRKHRRHGSRNREDRPEHCSQTEEHSGGRGFANQRDGAESVHSGQRYNQSGLGDEPQPSHNEHAISGALPVGAAAEARVEGAVEERLCGPDGTPFGYLPTRSKGVGLLAHATTTYQHIKAEQDAGHRNKGPTEKFIRGWLEKRRNVKSVATGIIEEEEEEEELLVEKNTSSHEGRRVRHDDRRKRRRSRGRGHNGDAWRGGHPVFMPVVERGGLSGRAAGNQPPTDLRRSFEQPAPSVRQPTVSRPPSRPPSAHVEPPG